MRTVQDSIRIALRALRVNAMRSTLAVLGIVIGVGAVIAMVSVGAGAEAQIEEQIASLGSNLLIVQPGSQNVGGVRQGLGAGQTLTLADAVALGRELPAVGAAAPVARGNAQVISAQGNWNTRIQGTTPEYLVIHNFRVAEGVTFTAADVEAISKVAVLGPTVRDALFPSGLSPLGQTIRVNQIPLTVIGVLQPKGQSPTGQDQDDAILIPVSTALKRVPGRTGARVNLVNNIDVQAASAELVPVAEQQIRDLLRYRHKLASGQDDDFQVRMLSSRFEARQEASQVMSLLLAAVAAVSLLVGGIGIMNIMLVSVTERTREIGIRQAVGAKSRAILMQFLAEAMTVSVSGGLGGIVLGVAASYAIAHFAGWPVVVRSGAVLLAFVFSALVGIFFGYYPARKAALLDPIEAIRHE